MAPHADKTGRDNRNGNHLEEFPERSDPIEILRFSDKTRGYLLNGDEWRRRVRTNEIEKLWWYQHDEIVALLSRRIVLEEPETRRNRLYSLYSDKTGRIPYPQTDPGWSTRNDPKTLSVSAQ